MPSLPPPVTLPVLEDCLDEVERWNTLKTFVDKARRNSSRKYYRRLKEYREHREALNPSQIAGLSTAQTQREGGDESSGSSSAGPLGNDDWDILPEVVDEAVSPRSANTPVPSPSRPVADGPSLSSRAPSPNGGADKPADEPSAPGRRPLPVEDELRSLPPVRYVPNRVFVGNHPASIRIALVRALDLSLAAALTRGAEIVALDDWPSYAVVHTDHEGYAIATKKELKALAQPGASNSSRLGPSTGSTSAPPQSASSTTGHTYLARLQRRGPAPLGLPHAQ
ncbi:uncharacterized protein EHS24_002232 [Apiotrichum porosum]|uniref:Uncharacterized protein n=1 Tax=Apiotrichum porosum TaxID=105984 RepID=A0A427XID2_9TREE|nr:uncharacterized protein EHS24_002232 [Apiotrichum porosum]RSH78507.1 hypothetical protein EHS24_002232 [Apiotrichum porosum]